MAVARSSHLAFHVIPELLKVSKFRHLIKTDSTISKETRLKSKNFQETINKTVTSDLLLSSDLPSTLSKMCRPFTECINYTLRICDFL
jgi:hypothetical protein